MSDPIFDNETDPQVQTFSKAYLEPPWHVVVLNDPVNLMSYVTFIFHKVFAYPLEKARKHTLEVHQDGRSILWSGPREKAEHYVYVLHQWQLNSILEKDA